MELSPEKPPTAEPEIDTSHVEEFVEQLNERIPYYRERHSIKPGITGWAQLCYPYGSSEQDATEKLQYDLFYVKNHTLLFYLAILVQTVEVIIWRKGAR